MAKMELVGTDVSIIECLNSGYLIMAYKPSIVTGEPIDPMYDFTFYTTNGSKDFDFKGTPTARRIENIVNKQGTFNDEGDNPYIQSSTCTLEDVLWSYERSKSSIDSCCSCNHSLDASDYKDVGDLFQLFDDVNAYNGYIFE